MPLARTQIRHFGGLRVVNGLENFQLFTVANENPWIAALVTFQPHTVVFPAHGCAIARKAQRVAIIAWQAAYAAVGLKLDGAALAFTADDVPFPAQISGIERSLKTRAGLGTRWCGFLGRPEMLLGAGIARTLHQVVALECQRFRGVAVEIDRLLPELAEPRSVSSAPNLSAATTTALCAS